MSDVFVVVRAAGERTEAAARALAEAEVGADAVATVREVPFAAALRRALELGAEAGRRWTLCLDADVLLRPGGVARLVAAAEAEAAREPLFGVSGTVADKLLGHVRAAGQHLYLTELIPVALRDGAFDPRKRRPESHLKRLMREAGHRWINLEVPIGLHDFEQSYADIFRKVFVHTRKHDRFMNTAARLWRRLSAEDPDYRVALVSKAIAEAITETEPERRRRDENVAIDRSLFPESVEPVLLPMNLAEKPPLGAGEIDGVGVEDRFGRFVDAPEIVRDLPLIEARWQGGRRAYLSARLQRDGPWRGPLWMMGMALREGGTRICRRAGDEDA